MREGRNAPQIQIQYFLANVETIEYSDDCCNLVYKGEVINGKPWGRGLMYYKEGSLHLGEWVNGIRNGHGRHTFSETDTKMWIEGTWKDDLLEGNATATYKDGSTSFGIFKNDAAVYYVFNFPPDNWRVNSSVTVKNAELHQGTGNITYSDGFFYTGDIVQDKMHGLGVMSLNNIVFYEGNFKDDTRDGHGILYLPDGSVYDGQFLNNLFHGVGYLIYPNSYAQKTYEGLFVNGLAHGKGTQTYKDGSVYEGFFANDVRQGLGVLTYPSNHSRLSFNGDFNKDDMVQGKLTWKNGQTYDGQFVNGQLNGAGVFTFPPEDERKSFTGSWSDDIPSNN